MHVALWKRDTDPGSVELPVDRLVKLGQGGHANVLRTHEAAQYQVERVIAEGLENN